MASATLLDQIYAASELRGPRRADQASSKPVRNKIVRPRRQMLCSNRLYMHGLMQAEKKMSYHQDRKCQEAEEEEEFLKSFSFHPQTNSNSASKDKNKDTRAKMGTHMLLYSNAVEPGVKNDSKRGSEGRQQSKRRNSQDNKRNGWTAGERSDSCNKRAKYPSTGARWPEHELPYEDDPEADERYQLHVYKDHSTENQANKPNIRQSKNINQMKQQQNIHSKAPRIQHHQIDLSEDEPSTFVIGTYVKPKRSEVQLEPFHVTNSSRGTFGRPMNIHNPLKGSAMGRPSVDSQHRDIMSDDLDFFEYHPEDERYREIRVTPTRLEQFTGQNQSQYSDHSSLVNKDNLQFARFLENRQHQDCTYQPRQADFDAISSIDQPGSQPVRPKAGFLGQPAKPFFQAPEPSDRLVQLPTEYASGRSAIIPTCAAASIGQTSKDRIQPNRPKRNLSHETLPEEQVLNKVKEFEDAFRRKRPHTGANCVQTRLHSTECFRPNRSSDFSSGPSFNRQSLHQQHSLGSQVGPRSYSLNLSVDDTVCNTKRTTDVSMLSSMSRNLRNTKTREMFEQLDSDGDGLISASKISITQIPLSKLKIISPLLLELEAQDKVISCSEFEDAVMDLARGLTQLDKQTLFYSSSTSKPVQQRLSEHSKPSITMRTATNTRQLPTKVFPTSKHQTVSRLPDRDALSFSFNLDRDIRRKTQQSNMRPTLVHNKSSNLDYHSEFRKRHFQTQSGLAVKPSSSQAYFSGTHTLSRPVSGSGPAKDDLAFTFGYNSMKKSEMSRKHQHEGFNVRQITAAESRPKDPTDWTDEGQPLQAKTAEYASCPVPASRDVDAVRNRPF